MSHPQSIGILCGAKSWENKVGSVALQNLAESLGVVRHRTETYSVGGFRYTNLTDAIAQPRWMANPKQAIG